ncbi:GumC family protein [Desulfatiglans anilini]|uniref:GumC family protein n=1 Tax=Desulfatiglans anilini TaxID=90728 RepID=UPI0004874070|nr:hypothetical protein [Desulfatiglans anilini]
MSNVNTNINDWNYQFDKVFYAIKSRGSLIMIVFLIIAIPLTLISLTKPEPQTAVAKIMFENNHRLSLELSSQLSERASRSTIAIERMNSQIEILKGNTLIEKVVKNLAIAKYPEKEDEAIKKVQQGIEAYLMPESTIIEISYTDSDPESAKMVLNTLLQLYKEYYSKNIEGENVFDFYNDRVVQIESELNKSIGHLNLLKSREGMYADIETVKNDLIQNIQNTKIRMNAANLKIAELDAQIKYIQDKLHSQPLQINNNIEMIANPEVISIKNQIALLELEKSNLLTKYVDDSREVKDVDTQIAFLYKQIHKHEPMVEGKRTFAINPLRESLRTAEMNLSTELDGVQKSRNELIRMILADEGRLAHLDTVEYQFIEAEQKVASGKKMHNFYLGKLDDARFVEAMNSREITSLNVIQSAQLKQKKRLATLSSVAAGTGLGAVIAVVFALILELFRPRLSRPDQIQEILGIPVLGSITNGHHENQRS